MLVLKGTQRGIFDLTWERLTGKKINNMKNSFGAVIRIALMRLREVLRDD